MDLYTKKVMMLLMPDLSRLKGMMMGTSICRTASLGAPIKMGVKIKLQTLMAAVMVMTPATNAIAAPFREWNFLYIPPATRTMLPVEIMCMIMPINWLEALTVMPWITLATTVMAKPEIGPNKNAPIRMGISAGSYSKKGAAGKIGK